MQTLEFTRALEEIATELKIGEMVNLLDKWLPPTVPQVNLGEPEKDNFQRLVLDSHAGYDRLLRRDATRKIIGKLKLDELFDAPRLRRLVAAVSSANVSGVIRSNAEFYAFFESLKSLLRLQTTVRDLLETEKVGKLDPSEGILELEIVDYDGKGIEPGRLTRIIFTVTNLYQHLARVLDVHDTPTFKYLDSGSGFLVGVQGAKAVIETMSTVLFQWWDKIRFRDYDTFDKRLDAVSKSLTVMKKVHQAVESGVINAETAENLKRRICQETDRLVGLGATLPLKEASEIDERQLLIEKRDVKLLGAGPPDEPDDGPDPAEPPIRAISFEE